MSATPAQLDEGAIADMIERLEEFELDDFYQGNGVLDLIDGVTEGYPACVFANVSVALGLLKESDEPDSGEFYSEDGWQAAAAAFALPENDYRRLLIKCGAPDHPADALPWETHPAEVMKAALAKRRQQIQQEATND